MTNRRKAACQNRIARTPLDVFCTRYKITTLRLADAANVSRSHVGRVRSGKVPRVTIDMAKQLARGAARILHRKVAVHELFDFDYFCWWP